MTKVGVGIVGCGNISTAYLTISKLFKAIDVRAVADINLTAAQSKAEIFGVDARSVENLLASDDISIVVNLTVPSAHYEVTRSILQAGKHAYSEKPLVMSLDEARDLRDLAERYGLRVGCAPDTFLGGAHQRVREAIDAGVIGRVIGGTCHIMGHGHEHWHPNPDFYYQIGGGPILDMGPYYITNLVQLIGPVRAVTAMSSASASTRTIGNGPRQGMKVPVETPTNLHATLEFRNGAIVTLGASWDVWAHRHKEMELYGETGSIYVPDPNFFGGAVTVVDTQQNVTDLDVSDHVFSQSNDIDTGGTRRANYRCAGLADMVAALQDGRAHRCNLDLAVHVVDVMTSILKAGHTQQWIEMTTTCERPTPLTAAEAKNFMA
jgi:predicted dehydrogenase|tara:strand:- start:173 stop:1306 length:1134 start_codon:yes stop_codon:yes gene_type:complete